MSGGLDIEGVLREKWPAFPGEAFTASDGHRSVRMVTVEEVAAVLREQIAAWLVAEADWRWEPDSEIPAVLAELAALVAPSRVPGEET